MARTMIEDGYRVKVLVRMLPARHASQQCARLPVEIVQARLARVAGLRQLTKA